MKCKMYSILAQLNRIEPNANERWGSIENKACKVIHIFAIVICESVTGKEWMKSGRRECNKREGESVRACASRVESSRVQ